MRVLTWNLWWKFGPWEDRQPAIAAELGAVAPDIALFQEVWATEGEDQATILAEDCGLEVVRSRRPDGEAHRFGNAILSRWPIEHLETVVLPAPEGKPSHRSAMAARVMTPSGPWVVVVTHLAWQYNESELRERQLDEVTALARRHRSDDENAPPVVLAGDLNAQPESDEIRRLTGLSRPYGDGTVFTDCWAAVGEGDGHTWSRDNPNSAEALWPRRRLDYVLVAWPRPKPLGNPLAASLVGVDPHDGVVGSDHYGVLVELDTRQPSQETR